MSTTSPGHRYGLIRAQLQEDLLARELPAGTMGTGEMERDRRVTAAAITELSTLVGAVQRAKRQMHVAERVLDEALRAMGARANR